MKADEVIKLIRSILDPKDLGESINSLINQNYVDPRILNDIRTREIRRMIGSEIKPTEIKLDYWLSNEFINKLQKVESRRQAEIKAIEDMVIQFYKDKVLNKDSILLLERLKHVSEEEARKILAQEFQLRYQEAMRLEELMKAMLAERQMALVPLMEAFKSYEEKKSIFIEHINQSAERIVDQMRNFESEGFRVTDHNSEEVMHEFAKRYQYEAIKLDYEFEKLEEKRRQPHLENTERDSEFNGLASTQPPPLSSYQIHQISSKINEHLNRNRDQRQALFDAVAALTGFYVKPEVKPAFVVQMEEWTVPTIKEGLDHYRLMKAKELNVVKSMVVNDISDGIKFDESFDHFFEKTNERILQSKML